MVLSPLARGASGGGGKKEKDEGDMMAELSEAESKLIAVGPSRPCGSAAAHPTWRCSGRLRVPGQLSCVLTPRALCTGAQHSTFHAQDDPEQNPDQTDWQARRRRRSGPGQAQVSAL